MLNCDDFKKISTFQKELLKLQFSEKIDFTFAQKTMEMLDSIFGYDTTIMAHLYTESEPVLVPGFQIHNVDMRFAEALYLKNAEDKNLFGISLAHDTFVLSRLPDYQKSSLYKHIFRKHGYCDCILKFIKYPDQDSYMSYIMLVSRNGIFTDTDTEILDELSPSIAQAFSNALTIFDIKTRYYVFRKVIDHFPIGIMLVERMNNVVFANATAQQYLKELGASDPLFYSTFYTNKIFPYYQNDVFGYRTSCPLRIKNFIFNVVPTGNEGLALNNILQTETSNVPYTAKDICSFDHVEACVYIIQDETPRTQGTQSFYDRFNLTKREREVLELILSGLSNHEIAERLVLSFNTVKIHVSNIYKKVDASNRIDLINKVQQYHLQD